MVRRIKSRKRKHLGNRSFGGGNTKNRRGKGCRGGVGRAGMGKHKRMLAIKLGEHLQTKKGFYSLTRRKPAAVSLKQLNADIEAGKYKEEGGAFNIALKHAKCLSNGDIKYKVNVLAAGFSKKAKQKIEEAGGTTKTVI